MHTSYTQHFEYNLGGYVFQTHEIMQQYIKNGTIGFNQGCWRSLKIGDGNSLSWQALDELNLEE